MRFIEIPFAGKHRRGGLPIRLHRAGAYIEGSSDIDFIAILRRRPAPPDIQAIAEAHAEVEKQLPAADLMGAYLLRADLGVEVNSNSQPLGRVDRTVIAARFRTAGGANHANSAIGQIGRMVRAGHAAAIVHDKRKRRNEQNRRRRIRPFRLAGALAPAGPGSDRGQAPAAGAGIRFSAPAASTLVELLQTIHAETNRIFNKRRM